jgi:hypothetical protein
MAALNVRSLIGHIDELRVFLATNPIDVLAINESWLDASVHDNEIHISHYEIVRRDRSMCSANGKTYGSVCFYLRSSIKFSPRLDLSSHQLENLSIEIRKPSSKPFIVSTWYRPPDLTNDKFSYFESFIGRLDSENVEYCLLGDLNCDLVASVLDHNSRSLTDIADLYGIHQLINEPTRVTESSSTIIDHIFTNAPDKVVFSGVSHVGISDHSLIYAFRKLLTGIYNKGHSTVTYRKFKNFDLDSFRTDICAQNWTAVNNFNDPNDMWRVWKNTFNNVVKKHAPLRTRRVRSSKSPWITPELKQHMHKRDILKVKAIRSKVPNDWAAFKTFRNYVTNEIKLVKETHYQNAFHQNKQNMKKTRGIVNELTSRKQSSPQVKEVKTNGSLYSQ